MNQTVQITDEQKATILRFIRAFFPNSQIYVFGSRVSGNAKRYSDLDISLDDGKTLDFIKLSSLKESFAESTLPFKVDLSDFSQLDANFKKHILENHVIW